MPMNSVCLIPVLHYHLPAGMSDEAAGASVRGVLEPFLKMLQRVAPVSLSLHCSGSVLEWLDAHAPDALQILAFLASRNQIELLSGTFYEAVLPGIPERDAIGQISRMNETLVRRFEQVPRGAWLAGQVWEPHLPALLHKTGIEYLVLDSGLDPSGAGGWRLTESNGYVVKILFADAGCAGARTGDELVAGLSRELRPVSRVWKADLCALDAGVAGNYEEFFEVLKRESAWLSTATCSSFLKTVAPSESPVYLAASGPGTGSAGGAYWKSALTQDAPANWLHKRMLRVSEKVWTSGGADPQALEYLWKAQGWDAYQPGADEGLRRHAYACLIRAEGQVDAALRVRRDWMNACCADFDVDGHEEVLLASSLADLYFSPRRGGQMLEFSHKASALNWVRLGPDASGWFEDRLLPGVVTRDSFRAAAVPAYEPALIDRQDAPVVKMIAPGCDGFPGVTLEKTFQIAGFRKLVAEYRVRVPSREGPGILLAVSMNLAVPPVPGGAVFENPAAGLKIPVADAGEDEALQTLVLDARGCGLEFRASAPAKLWRRPVPEAGGPGGVNLVWVWPVAPEPDGVFRVQLVCDAWSRVPEEKPG